jgi:UDP-glucose 4-epimerase
MLDDYDVVVFDSLRTGNLENLKQVSDSSKYNFIEGDIRNLDLLKKSMVGSDIIFHLAANADVRSGIIDRTTDININIIGTHNVLEAMVSNNVKKIIFASSATVYGDPNTFPTPENEELIQTSIYGASKLAGEALIEAYSNYFDIDAYIFRFVSWIGPRYSHGVIYDFYHKLKNNPKILNILGDGSQVKSYLDVKDGVEGIFMVLEHSPKGVNIYNLGHDESMNVVDLANIVISEMGLSNVKFKFMGGKRGWKGDSPVVLLDTSKIKDLAWNPRIDIESGIRRTVKFLIENE